MTATWTIPVHLEPIPVPPEAGDLPVPHYVDCFIRDAEQAAEELGPDIAFLLKRLHSRPTASAGQGRVIL